MFYVETRLGSFMTQHATRLNLPDLVLIPIAIGNRS